MNSWFFFYCAGAFAAFGIDAMFDKQPGAIIFMFCFLCVVFHVVGMWERDKFVAHHNFIVKAAQEMQKLLGLSYNKLVKLEKEQHDRHNA